MRFRKEPQMSVSNCFSAEIRFERHPLVTKMFSAVDIETYSPGIPPWKNGCKDPIAAASMAIAEKGLISI